MDHTGWEIGLHPSWNAHNDLKEMIYQKDQIEGVLGHPIQSVRQHFLKYDPLSTHKVQSGAGFKYDSTLGYNDNLGFRRGTSYPFSCVDMNHGKQLPLLQIPLIIQDGALLASGKGMRVDEQKALEYIKVIVEEVKAVGGVLSLSWHPHTINWPGFKSLYQKTLEVVARENPWFAPVSAIGEWWTKNSKIDLLKFTKNLESS